MKTGFLSLLQTIYLSASCVQIPRAVGGFYHVWKRHNVQLAKSEMRRSTIHALYRSKLLQQDHCQHPQNANSDGSTLEGTAQRIGRPFGGGGAEAQGWGHRQENPLQGVHRKGPGNHWWNSPAVQWSPGVIRWPVAYPGCGSRTRRRPTSPKKPRLGYRWSATTLYPSLTAPYPTPSWTRWTTSFGHTSRTSPTWPPTTPKPAWSLPSAEYSPSSRRRLWKRHAPSFGSVSRRWLRLKAATLNICQLYYIIKLPELIFSIKDLK